MKLFLLCLLAVGGCRSAGWCRDIAYQIDQSTTNPVVMVEVFGEDKFATFIKFNPELAGLYVTDGHGKYWTLGNFIESGRLCKYLGAHQWIENFSTTLEADPPKYICKFCGQRRKKVKMGILKWER